MRFFLFLSASSPATSLGVCSYAWCHPSPTHSHSGQLVFSFVYSFLFSYSCFENSSRIRANEVNEIVKLSAFGGFLLVTVFFFKGQLLKEKVIESVDCNGFGDNYRISCIFTHVLNTNCKAVSACTSMLGKSVAEINACCLLQMRMCLFLLTV